MACRAESVIGPSINPPQCSEGLQDIKLMDTLSYNGPFPNLTMGHRTGFYSDHSRGLADLANPIPDEWNWYEKEPDRIENGHRNQGSCGSCWAFATVSVLGDRYAIKYKTKAPYPSVAFLLSCFDNAGLSTPGQACCCGGVVEYAAEYLVKNGTKLEICWPYNLVTKNRRSCPSLSWSYAVPPCLQSSELAKCCHSCCGTSIADVGYFVEKDSVKPLAVLDSGVVNVDKTIAAIQRDIMAHGPIATSMYTFGGTSVGDEGSSPVTFKEWWDSNAGSDAIFSPSAPHLNDGGHAVVIVGWGTLGGTRYWIVRNSWGSPGFYRQAMTTSDISPENRCGLDVPSLYESDMGLTHGVVSFLPGSQHGTPPDNPYPFTPDSENKIDWKPILKWVAIGVGILFVLLLLRALF